MTCDRDAVSLDGFMSALIGDALWQKKTFDTLK